MKQLDIMGNEIDYFELNKPQTNIHESLKDRFRRINGYLNGKTCKECKYHKAFNYNYKTYHKCEKMGISSSEATDIRLKDCACKLFEDRSVNICVSIARKENVLKKEKTIKYILKFMENIYK